MARIIKKLWGQEIWHHNDSLYCMKTLIINPGFMSSLHYHKVKSETFLVVRGKVLLEVGQKKIILGVGDSADISPKIPHRFMSTIGVSTVIEASTMHDDEDVYRIERSKETKEHGRADEGDDKKKKRLEIQ